MEGLVINISWEYFFGIMGALLVIAWHSGSKFSKIETSTNWIKEKINNLENRFGILESQFHDLKNQFGNLKENVNSYTEEIKLDLNKDAFDSHSPISLTDKGQKLLADSGMKKYIDNNRDVFLANCEDKTTTNSYEIQEHIFSLFSKYTFPPEIDDMLKEYAFNQGVDMSVIRRIGAIYFRDICLKHFQKDPAEIDLHSQSTTSIN
jgi:hypothetical protein